VRSASALRDRSRGFFPAHDDDRAAVVQWSKRRREVDGLEQSSILMPAIAEVGEANDGIAERVDD